MRHTVGMRQSVILTRKVDYAAFCQGAIMSFYSTMRLGVVRVGGVRLGCMRHFTTPPKIGNVGTKAANAVNIGKVCTKAVNFGKAVKISRMQLKSADIM